MGWESYEYSTSLKTTTRGIEHRHPFNVQAWHVGPRGGAWEDWSAPKETRGEKDVDFQENCKRDHWNKIVAYLIRTMRWLLSQEKRDMIVYLFTKRWGRLNGNKVKSVPTSASYSASVQNYHLILHNVKDDSYTNEERPNGIDGSHSACKSQEDYSAHAQRY